MHLLLEKEHVEVLLKFTEENESFAIILQFGNDQQVVTDEAFALNDDVVGATAEVSLHCV